MSNENSPPPTPTSPSTRRASFSPGQKLSELFGRSPPTPSETPAYPGPISTAAANAQAQQRRRTSIAGLGISGSPTQPSSLTHLQNRQSSFGSGSPSSIEENAVEDGDSVSNPSPTSPFARRMSFGARALRDIRTGAANGNSRASIALTPSVKGRGEGFDWSEQIKNRAERSASITQRPAPAAVNPAAHQRAVSVAAAEQPIKEMPKSPKKPDHFQERILKGDFYMD